MRMFRPRQDDFLGSMIPFAPRMYGNYIRAGTEMPVLRIGGGGGLGDLTSVTNWMGIAAVVVLGGTMLWLWKSGSRGGLLRRNPKLNRRRLRVRRELAFKYPGSYTPGWQKGSGNKGWSGRAPSRATSDPPYYGTTGPGYAKSRSFGRRPLKGYKKNPRRNKYGQFKVSAKTLRRRSAKRRRSR